MFLEKVILTSLVSAQTHPSNALDRGRRSARSSKAKLFGTLLFFFLERAKARPVLAFDELFDALLLPRAALQKR